MNVVDSSQRYQLILQLWNIVHYLQAFVKGGHHSIRMILHPLMIVCEGFSSEWKQILQVW